MKTGITETPSSTKAIAHEPAARAHEQPPNVKQLQTYQLMANNSPRVQAQAQLQAAANRNGQIAQRGPGIVQRTAVRISFNPGAPAELVPGTTEEDNIMFFNALQNKEKYTPEKVKEIATWMSRPGASEWDKGMAAFLNREEEEKDDEENIVIPELDLEEEEETTTTITSERDSDATDSSGKKSRKRGRSKSTRQKDKAKESQKKKAKVKKKKKDIVAEASGEEEEEAVTTGEKKEEKKGKTAARPDIEWNGKTARGKLVDDQQWWVKVGSYHYGIMNVAAIAPKLLDGQRVTYTRPVQDYGAAAKAAGIKKQIDEYGVLVTTIAGAPVDRTLPAEQTEGIIAWQEAAREASEKRETEKASGLKTYRPSLLEEKYAVKWGRPALSIKGTTRDRTMVKTMDIGYQPTGADRPLALPGERLHDKDLYAAESLHGNGINARFSLVYLEGGVLKLATGSKLFFGSGKTTSSIDDKHENADEIATMLVSSGQISDVGKYDDGKHAHSEQSMIVYLSKKLDIFDEQLATLSDQTVSVVALVLDMYSNPNTVCEHCHPSLATFFTTTNWKSKITKRLQGTAGENVEISAPDVVIRVSSSKSFSASATAAIPKATATHTVKQGEHDINFIERVPFNKSHY